ncbi:MAG: quinol:cytochrome C oxidoreductase, partial [Bacteroidota bacterium]|nr:quinol:cytochrome C oxidoreductase [Bacteroidota bacterium]
MMYSFSKYLKIFSLILMVLGAAALGIGFLSAPTTVEEAKAMVADAHGHGGHGGHGDQDTHADDHHGKNDEAYAHSDSHDVHGGGHGDSHDKHLLHQLQ